VSPYATFDSGGVKVKFFTCITNHALANGLKRIFIATLLQLSVYFKRMALLPVVVFVI